MTDKTESKSESKSESKTEKVIVRVSEETKGFIDAYAKERDLEICEAADKLIAKGTSRLAGLDRYAKKTKK